MLIIRKCYWDWTMSSTVTVKNVSEMEKCAGQPTVWSVLSSLILANVNKVRRNVFCADAPTNTVVVLEICDNMSKDTTKPNTLNYKQMMWLIRWLNKTKDGALHVAAPSAHQPSVSSLLHKPLPAADKKRMDNVLIYFITRDTQSFSVVTNMAFVAYSRALHGSYRAILHPTLRCTTDAKYEQCSQSTKPEEPLKSDDRHPDQHSNRSVPHSDSTWSNEKLLSCQLHKSRHNNTCMPKRHSTDNTAEPEERCTRKAAKICTIVTDRAAALNTAGGTT